MLAEGACLEPLARRCQKSAIMAKPQRILTEGQRAYEAKRAEKAGMSLERWLAEKERRQQEEERARRKAAEPPKPPKKPGFLARLIERAHKPL
jgi:folate-dependent phosphoribosylglycinamide formyltransferase PurN